MLPWFRLTGSPVSSIYIWSKNLGHSSKQQIEAKYGGNWRSYSTSVSVPCATISLNGISIFPRRGLKLTYYSHTIAFKFPPSLASLQQPSSYSRYIWSSLPEVLWRPSWYSTVVIFWLHFCRRISDPVLFRSVPPTRPAPRSLTRDAWAALFEATYWQ